MSIGETFPAGDEQKNPRFFYHVSKDFPAEDLEDTFQNYGCSWIHIDTDEFLSLYAKWEEETAKPKTTQGEDVTKLKSFSAALVRNTSRVDKSLITDASVVELLQAIVIEHSQEEIKTADYIEFMLRLRPGVSEASQFVADLMGEKTVDLQSIEDEEVIDEDDVELEGDEDAEGLEEIEEMTAPIIQEADSTDFENPDQTEESLKTVLKELMDGLTTKKVEAQLRREAKEYGFFLRGVIETDEVEES